MDYDQLLRLKKQKFLKLDDMYLKYFDGYLHKKVNGKSFIGDAVTDSLKFTMEKIFEVEKRL